MWFVLDQIWPVRTITVMRRAGASVLRDAGRVIALIDSSLPPASYKKESNSLRDRLGKQLATIRILKEATQYEFGVDHKKQMRTGDTFMRMSMTTVALIWNQAALLHSEGERESLRLSALISLRQAIAQRLSAMADALEQKGLLRMTDAVEPLGIASGAVELDSEYSRYTIARYNELQTLALSLDRAE